MAITFPSWYEGGFEDMELVVKTILEKHLVGGSPVGVYAWLPEDWRAEMPLVAIARDPSGVEEDDQHDEGQVQVWCLAASRADAWALAEFVRQVMKAYKRGVVEVDGRRVPVSIRRAEGPSLSMDEDAFGERIVPLSFVVKTRARASLPDYEEILSS